MIRLAWERMKNRKTASLTMLFAFICLFVLIPYGLQQAKETTLAVNHTIEQYGRGTYDILVRPHGSRTEIETTLGVVAENYIGDSKGGISIAEWKELKQDPNIGVAAPVASLGYFRGKNYTIKLPPLDHPTRFTWQFVTSDGLHDYLLDDPGSLTYFEEVRPDFTQYYDNTGGGIEAALVSMPASFYPLMGIDPDSEELLTNIDFSSLNETISDEEAEDLEFMQETYGDPDIVKVLQREDLHIPLRLKLEMEPLDVTLEETLQRFDLTEDDWLMNTEIGTDYEEREAYFENLQELDSKTVDVDLSNHLHPFDGEALKLNQALELSSNIRPELNFGTSLYYTADAIEYDNLHETPTVEMVENGNPPAYKNTEEKGADMKMGGPVPFLIHQMGKFTVNDKEWGNEFVASPMGIYGGMEAETADGEKVTPTTIPGSFIQAPAGGVTSLKSAELIKGDEPIDAIRIRVAGIDSYNEVAQKRIDHVAKGLLEKGYEVDVVAGASYAEMELDVEGIGRVIESWTTLGAAQDLTSTWNKITLFTTFLFIAFGILWLAVRLTFEKNTLASENELLYQIGWRRSKVNLRNGMEHYLLLTTAFVLSMFILLVLQVEGRMVGAAAGLWGLSMGMATLLIMKRQKVKQRTFVYKWLASIRYYKRFIVPTMLMLVLSTLLIAVQVATLGHTVQEVSVTTLGAYTFDVTFWIQISILLSTLILASAGMVECINTLLLERKSEFRMYHVIGWHRGRILKHFAKEISIWAMVSILFGVVSGGMLLQWLDVTLLWILAGAGVSVLLSVIMIAFIVSTRKLMD